MSTTSLNREQLAAYWMPFTGNRQFKQDPRMVVAAEVIALGPPFVIENSQIDSLSSALGETLVELA